MGLHPVPVIVTDRLTMTPLTVADAEAMVEIYGDPRMYEFTGGSPPTAVQLRKRYESLVEGSRDRAEQWCNLIVRGDASSSPVGAMQATVATDLSWAAVAWEIGIDHQGQGLASQAAGALVGWLLESGVRRITASIHPDHVASAGVARHAGMTATDEIDDGEIVWQRIQGDGAHVRTD